MKNNIAKIICILIIFSVFTINFAACANNNSENDGINIVTSVYPVYDFACKIAGESANVTLLIPAGAEPHDWEPRASDMAKIQSADIFIYSGAGLEHWVSDVLSSADNKNLLVVDTSKNIQIISENGESDPHIWLDPACAKMQFDSIYEAFCEKAENPEIFSDNYAEYSAEFEKLIGEYAQIRDIQNKNLVTIHSAFGYLCRGFGLTQTSVSGLTPEGEPSAARMAEVAEFVKSSGVKTIFYESDASKSIAEAVAKESEAEVAFLNTIEWLTADEIQKGYDYFSVMRTNLDAILKIH